MVKMRRIQRYIRLFPLALSAHSSLTRCLGFEVPGPVSQFIEDLRLIDQAIELVCTFCCVQIFPSNGFRHKLILTLFLGPFLAGLAMSGPTMRFEVLFAQIAKFCPFGTHVVDRYI